MRAITAACLCTALFFAAFPAQAETSDGFIARIGTAFKASNKPAALKTLFYLKGVDPETMQMYDRRIIGRMLSKYDNPSVALEPLPDDFNGVQIIGAFEYSPNLNPLGYVVLAGRTRVPYGQHKGRYFIVAMNRKAFTPPATPDKMLQMMVIGMGSPPIRYRGHCDIMQGNGKIRRMEMEDAGRGNNTAIITAQHVVACDLVNISARGTLSLRVQEGKTVVFNERVEAPANSLTYRRKAR